MTGYLVQHVPKESIAHLARVALGFAVTPDARALGAYGADGALRGFVLYDRWTRTGVEMHVALAKPGAARALRYHALAYPFLEGGKEVALGFVRASNRKSRALAEGLGFRRAHRILDGWDIGEDMLLYELRKSDWLAMQDERKAAA